MVQVSVTKAIILAAGLGSRLQPLTADVPKCLTEVDGEPILEHQLEALVEHGITDITIAIGYLGEQVIATLDCYVWAGVTFIENPDYATTNSAYSLYLARRHLRDGCLIIEGDVMFEPAVLGLMLSDQSKSWWLVDKAEVGDTGCILSVDEDDRVASAKVVNEPLKAVDGYQYKSAGMQYLTAEGGKHLEYRLIGSTISEHKDEFLALCLNDMPIYAKSVGQLKWGEIDTRADLQRVEGTFTERTKYVVVVMDGAADNPQYDHEGKTPLELAATPALDKLAAQGKTGMVQTMYPGLPLGSIVGMLGLMGYNPTRYYPNGRASFEAIAQGIYLDEDEIAFRCNWVRLDKTDKLVDATPKIAFSNIPKWYWLGFPTLQFSKGQNYRNTVIAKNPNCTAEDVKTYEPHEHIGEDAWELLPVGNNKVAHELAMLMLTIPEVISGYTLFPWSPSSAPHLPSFYSRHSLDGAVVSAMDFMIGIGRVARMEAQRIDGTTGYSDTDLEAKLKATQNALRYNDIVFVHINAPDEESHKRDLGGKVAIIERIDSDFLAPLRAYLFARYPNSYRLAVLPDHYSYVATGKHGSEPVPYVIHGMDVQPDGVAQFSEQAVKLNSKAILKSYEFMDFLRGE